MAFAVAEGERIGDLISTVPRAVSMADHNSDLAVAASFLAIAGSVAVGIFSFLGARSGSRETVASNHRKNRFDGDLKIAQYRIDWIADLRKQLIELDRIVISRQFGVVEGNYHINVIDKMSSIRFRLSRDNPLNDRLLNVIVDLANLPAERTSEKVAEFSRIHMQFANIGNDILHEAWQRVEEDIRRAGIDKSYSRYSQRVGLKITSA